MKKIVVPLLLLIITFTYSKVAYGTTTFSYDKTVRGSDATYRSGEFDSKARDVESVNFSYIKRIKIDLEHQSGKYQNNYWLDMELSNIQVGLRVINHLKQIIYITAGGLKYTEHVENIEEFSAHEADGSMIGIDYVGILTDKFQIELNLQKSLGISSQFSYFSFEEYETLRIKSPAELTVYKIKLRYLLTDNLGLTYSYRSMDLNIKDPSSDDVKTFVCSAGFIYRF